MAQPANMGPYIANLQLEQRRRELRAARFEPLVQSAFDITKLMFALDERRQARAKEKLETMHSIMEMWGPDKMPQSLLNEYGAGLDTLAGGKMVPRDEQGNVLPPEPSIQQEGRRRLAQMPPEQRKKFFDRMLGMAPSAAEEARLEELKLRDAKEERHWKIQESIAWAHAQRVGSANAWRNEPSQYTMGPDGAPRLAEPNESVMTRQDLLEWENVNQKNLQARNLMMRTRKLQKEIKEDAITGKMLTSTVMGLMKMKDNDPNKSAVFNVFWDKWRKYEMAHGEPDPGLPQAKKGWMAAKLAEIHSLLTAAIGPETAFTAGKASGPPAEPKAVSPKDEVKHLEGIFGVQP